MFKENLKNLIRHKRWLEEFILLVILTLSLLGIGITDFSPLESHRYWSLMIVLFAIASIALGWSREEYQGKIFKDLIVHQSIHWGATLVTISGIYFLLNAGRLNYESAGLIIEIILGFSLFLDGRYLGWRYSLLGVMVGITAIVAAYVEEFFWVILLVTLLLAVLAFFWEKARRKRLQQHEIK